MIKISTKDDIKKQMDKLKEAVNSCNSDTPVIALDMGENIEIAFNFGKIDRVELAEIHREAFMEVLAFQNNCSCKKKVPTKIV